MRSRKLLLLIVLAVSFGGAAGCRVEGFKDGINDGVSAALSALISTPITHALDQQFKNE
jgi:hypothetical protein